MQLQRHDIHVWSVNLATCTQPAALMPLLSADECHRAKRFHNPIHQQRFVIAHAALRQILALYLPMTAQQIEFVHSAHNKPLLPTTYPLPIQFNLSHSHEIAVIALTLNHAIGIDVEKITSDVNMAIAKRYFNPIENQALQALPSQKRTQGFYRIWSRKEALVKAIGVGLQLPLNSFAVALDDRTESITLDHQSWFLAPLTIHPDYASAIATNQPIKTITYQQFMI